MEDYEKGKEGILFSRAIKAGKRIYYVDVKNSKSGDFYIAMTESKKVLSGDSQQPNVNFEKHKIFLYKESFHSFLECLQEAINCIEQKQDKADTSEKFNHNEIKIDLDF